jgi:hypothetical protein
MWKHRFYMHIREQNQHHHERFEANRRFEEMTDIAERLGYRIDTTIRYGVRSGAAYALTDTVDRPFHNQTFQAWQRGQQLFSGDQAFEVERLRLEHEEALMVDALGRGEMNGNVLIKLSKVPDAVVENTTSIKGYRRDLQRSFVRIYFTDADGINCRLFSLDHNHGHGMKQVGELIGIAADRPSEAVLADHALLHVPHDTEQFVEALVARTIETYDAAIYERSGSRTHAGSTFTDQVNAMQAVSVQPRLLTEHMDAISAIMNSGRLDDDREARLESQRERMAAAVKLASQGYSIASSASADVASEVSSGNYGRECATATGMNQTQTANMENVWQHGECQVCFARTSVGSCMVCANCAAADDRGEDLLKLRERNLRIKQMQSAAVATFQRPGQKRTASKTTDIGDRYGQYVQIRKVITIGGQDTLVVNRDGDVIDKL